MTLEEMIGQFKAYTEYPNQDTFVISNQECKDILKYLTEQEPCEDAISRQAVLDVIEREEFKGDAISEIEKLSSVIPQPKTGRWIRCYVIQEFKCSECRVCFRNTSNYCPNCGARMESD